MQTENAEITHPYGRREKNVADLVKAAQAIIGELDWLKNDANITDEKKELVQGQIEHIYQAIDNLGLNNNAKSAAFTDQHYTLRIPDFAKSFCDEAIRSTLKENQDATVDDALSSIFLIGADAKLADEHIDITLN